MCHFPEVFNLLIKFRVCEAQLNKNRTQTNFINRGECSKVNREKLCMFKLKINRLKHRQYLDFIVRY